MKAASFVSALLLAVAAGAQAQGMSMPMKPAASASARSTAPLVDAEIRKLDAKKGSIVLKHGEIPNLGMGPMTMAFEVADRKMLKGLKVGDKVRFRADVVEGKATVIELRKVH
jgi:Cu(I)/Ag(I) efflux system membrane protein CusA/SilA